MLGLCKLFAGENEFLTKMESVEPHLHNFHIICCFNQRRPIKVFTASRGLRQRNPLSPLLLIVVIEVLNGLMNRAKELQLLRGVYVGSSRNSIEVSHLFSADDTLLF